MPTRAKIVPENWEPTDFHGPLGSPYEWRLTPQGLDVRQRHAPFKGLPPLNSQVAHIVPSIIERFDEDATSAAEAYKLPKELLIATAAAESGGNKKASRVEEHLDDASFGLCQILTSTARFVGRSHGWPVGDDEDNIFEMPRRPLPNDSSLGNFDRWQRFMGHPLVNFGLAAGVYYVQNARWEAKGDPVLLYASYNSGGVYADTTGRRAYGLHATVSAVEAFVLFYNEACRLLRSPA